MLDVLLPPRCLSCGGAVDMQGNLCPSCWQRATFLGPPLCACCGLPFEFEVDPQSLCGACHRQPPQFARARAAMVYDEGSRAALLGFKHRDQTHAAMPFARWMVRAGAEILADADLLVPVPLHRWRLFRRRYNQAGMLALAIGRLTGIAVAADALARTRATPSQGGLDRSARARNVRGAFVVRPTRSARIRGRRAVLIDDVMTTGATVQECARVLRRGGAESVDVLTLARVVRPSP